MVNFLKTNFKKVKLQLFTIAALQPTNFRNNEII